MSPLTAQPPAKDAVPAQVEEAEDTQRQHRSAIKAAFIGTFIEWFDYAAYIYMSAIISRVFFPEMEGRRALIMTFALFALSFLVRPLGGIVWGHFGDKYGRIQTLTVSIVMMSVATACIGFLPGYATIGFAASILLLLCRMVQGFSAAGEYAGAATHLAEIAPAGKRGIYSAVVPSATASGLLLGSLIAALLTGVLDDATLESWGWRVPFLIALPLGLYGLWIRRNTEESSHFEDQDEPEESPLREVLKYPKALAIAFAGAVLNAIGFYVILTYLPTYLSEELGMAATPAFIASSVASAFYVGFALLTGMLSDRLGRRTTMLCAAAFMGATIIPAFMLLDGAGLFLVIIIQVCLAGDHSAGGVLKAIILILPVLVFSFSFVAAISQFSLGMEKEYGADHHAQSDKVIRNSAILLTIFTMFFVWSCALAMGADGMQEANDKNLPVLSYFANETGTQFMAYMAPIVVICAVASSYFGHALGTIEGTQYLFNLGAPKATKKMSTRTLDLWTYLFIFVSTSLVGIFNPSILDMISVVGGVFFAFMTYLLPIWVIYRVEALARFRGNKTNFFVAIMGLIVLFATIWGMFQ